MLTEEMVQEEIWGRLLGRIYGWGVWRCQGGVLFGRSCFVLQPQEKWCYVLVAGRLPVVFYNLFASSRTW